ncbi:MAG: thiazole biosynthesis protein [Spirochaetales bacterium]|nr:thiazole biosynthesis protein [Spirochaetales bacterium]
MEHMVSQSIVTSFFEKFRTHLNLDVAIVGGGPSGLVAAGILAEGGLKTAVFERKLAPGGGMWGGAMMFNQIVVQSRLKGLLDRLGIQFTEGENDTVLIDSVHAASALIFNATNKGAVIFNCMSVEDVILKSGRVGGIVINWAPVHREGLHIDPLMICARYVIDGTGHPSEVTRILAGKNDIRLDTATGGIIGERSLDVEEGERTTVENTGEVFPGLYICGMAANGVRGSFRMGPIFGGMLESGKKTAQLILKDAGK